MNGENFKVFSGRVDVERVWCGPLKLYFPHVFRLTDGACGDPEGEISCESFGLFGRAKKALRLKTAAVVDRLDAAAEFSLLVRRHDSGRAACDYAGGAGDVEPIQPHAAIWRGKKGVFTLSRVRTRENWPGPMIFYLADISKGRPVFDMRHWEKSVGPDGVLRKSKLFYEHE